jgi:hypothetical protein
VRLSRGTGDMSDDLDEPQGPALISLGEVLIAVYLPFVWTLFSKTPAIPNHRFGSFVVMPTFLVQSLLFDLTGSAVYEIVCPMLGLIGLACLAGWGRHGGAKRFVAVAGAFVGSIALSVATAYLLRPHTH